MVIRAVVSLDGGYKKHIFLYQNNQICPVQLLHNFTSRKSVTVSIIQIYYSNPFLALKMAAAAHTGPELETKTKCQKKGRTVRSQAYIHHFFVLFFLEN